MCDLKSKRKNFEVLSVWCPEGCKAPTKMMASKYQNAEKWVSRWEPGAPQNGKGSRQKISQSSLAPRASCGTQPRDFFYFYLEKVISVIHVPNKYKKISKPNIWRLDIIWRQEHRVEQLWRQKTSSSSFLHPFLVIYLCKTLV